MSPGMKWLGRASIGLALLIVIALALPFLIPLDGYIPRIEQAASASLNRPVSIKRIRVGALPLPRVTVDGITIGTATDFSIGEVVITPDLFSLLQSTKLIKRIDVDNLALTRKGIEEILAWAKPDATQSPQQSPQVRVERIRFNSALVNFGKASFGPFDARVRLDDKGAAQDASIFTRDGKLKASIKPENSQYLFDVSATSWPLPAGPALLFDELTIKGVATPDGADLGAISAKLYGGTATGKTRIDWRKGLRLEGRFDIRQLELKQIASLLSPGAHVSGKLDAEPVFSASAPSADQLMHALRLATCFDVQNGTLYGVDIEKAATHLIKKPTPGGETRFEQLSGHLVMERGGYRFTQLKIASGALAAEGNVSISAKKDLSGRIKAQVKAAGVSANVPLNVAGTVASPLLYPTGGTMAGAALGTAVMGPGVGTTLGAKVGGWVEGLFDKTQGKKPKE